MPFDPEKYLAEPTGFDPDKYLAEDPIAAATTRAENQANISGTDKMLLGAARGIQSGAQSAIGAVGKLSGYVDAYNPLPTGAAGRAGIGALQEGKGLGEAAQVYGHQYGRDPEEAPTFSQIAEKAGVSGEKTLPGIVKNPWNPEENKISPADVVGTVAGTLADPLTYAGAGGGAKAVEGAAVMAGKATPRLAEYLEQASNTRTLKAATGQNKRALGKIFKLGQEDKIAEDLKESGVVRAGSSVKGIASRAEDGRENAWAKMKSTMDEIDAKTGDKSVSGKAIAAKIRERMGKLSDMPLDDSIRSEMQKYVDYFEKSGDIPLVKAQDARNRFKFKMTDSKTHALGQDGNNQLAAAIGESMDDAVKSAFANEPEKSAEYLKAKSQYGSFATIAGEAKDRVVADLSNRLVSPSDYASGLATMAGQMAKGENGLTSGLYGMAVGLANNQLRLRGNSTMAIAAHQLARTIEKTPERLEKWLPALKAAGAAGGASFAAAHQHLMQTDPDYRRTLFIEGAK